MLERIITIGSLLATCMTVGVANSSANAAALAIRFDVVVSEVDLSTDGLFDEVAAGDTLAASFELVNFPSNAGVALGTISVSTGGMQLSAYQYNFIASNNGSNVFPPNPDADSLLVFCPGGDTGFSCDLAAIPNASLGWDVSFNFGGPSTVFDDPAVDFFSIETWQQFEVGRMSLSVGDLSGLGTRSRVRGDIVLPSVRIVPEPASVSLLACTVLSAGLSRRSRLLQTTIEGKCDDTEVDKQQAQRNTCDRES